MQDIGDNGKVVNKEESVNKEKPELQTVEMRIIVEPGKPCMVHFPFLMDKVATYGFLKIAEKTLDAHYAQANKPKIVQPKGSMMNFARHFKKN